MNGYLLDNSCSNDTSIVNETRNEQASYGVLQRWSTGSHSWTTTTVWSTPWIPRLDPYPQYFGYDGVWALFVLLCPLVNFPIPWWGEGELARISQSQSRWGLVKIGGEFHDRTTTRVQWRENRCQVWWRRKLMWVCVCTQFCPHSLHKHWRTAKLSTNPTNTWVHSHYSEVFFFCKLPSIGQQLSQQTPHYTLW